MCSSENEKNFLLFLWKYMKKITQIFTLIITLFLLSGCFWNDQVKTSFNEKKYDLPKAYSWCSWEENKNDILSFSSQNCLIWENKIRINKWENENQFFFEINSWSGFVQNKLALEVFRFDNIWDSNAKDEWKKKFLQEGNDCDFKKNLLYSNGDRDYLYLISWSGASCWEYGSQSDKWYKNFFLFYPEKKETLIFIRQFSDKKILNENSIILK